MQNQDFVVVVEVVVVGMHGVVARSQVLVLATSGAAHGQPGQLDDTITHPPAPSPDSTQVPVRHVAVVVVLDVLVVLVLVQSMHVVVVLVVPVVVVVFVRT
ncbi:hypothetical protein [Fimbriiglobus ruber]|uniref:Uncharacterized protein n=1 Tax=Fimbriiglobus ruber TaxID=1908690 RepID=A0A225DPM4_9BACT|nr:hypothetical protein [Fimbriiglobus ruber]OWK38127.1 hypothetical protein FRUB_07247 [Fimbriiglobus ruber]